MSIDLIIVAICLSACSGLPGVFLARSSPTGERLAAALMVGATLAGLTGAALGFLPSDRELIFPWPAANNSPVAVDALSAFFLVPVFLMGGLGSIYGLGYWPQRRNPRNGRRLRMFWGLMVAGMGILMISRNAMGFLLGWEVMTLSAFLLVGIEDIRAECRRASWIYLVATHVGTLALFFLFALWRWTTGSYALLPVAADAIPFATLNGMFLLALLGFGLKSGLMPLHFWLPGAHANAPSHVSAMLSGVLLKTGIYGLVRFLSLLPDPPGAWGGLILALGAVSALFGVVFALGQHDLKRLLAYHSVENIGIILMGLGLAMLGRSSQRPDWVVLGLAGCLLHVWNHGLFKSLLFLCAGSVIHSTRTGQIDRLGGLARTMPVTAAMFLLGAVAISGLPPLNGFVSEFLVYLGLLQAASDSEAGATAVVMTAPVLAMVGALAVACFVKVYGAVFLGAPRVARTAHGAEAPFTMRAPMVILAGSCVLIGLAPALVVPLLDGAIASWRSGGNAVSVSLDAVAPLTAVGTLSAILATAAVGLAVVLMRRGRATRRAVTWDCGYAQPTSRMQYTASSFARSIVTMFGWVLRPHTHGPQLNGLSPQAAGMHTHVDEAVLDRWLIPAGRSVRRCFNWFHRFQQGLTQHYVLYILITLIVMLSTLIPFNEVLTRLFAR